MALAVPEEMTAVTLPAHAFWAFRVEDTARSTLNTLLRVLLRCRCWLSACRAASGALGPSPSGKDKDRVTPRI